MKPQMLAILCALALLAASPVSEAAFTGRVVAQVFDAQFRPVQGAQAYVEHQLNSVTGNVKTKPVLTNSSGEALITFTNYEEIESDMDYSYTLYVKYGDQLQTATLTASNETGSSVETRRVTVMVNAAFGFVRVHDQFGSPLSANLSLGGQSKQTDSQGSAMFQLPPSNYTLKVERLGSVINRPFDLTGGDKRLDLEIGLYPLQVKVLDDRRTPISGATVDVAGQQAKTGKDGVAVFYNVSDRKPEITVQNADSVKRTTLDLGSQNKLEVTFDLTKPQVKETHVSLGKSGGATISLFVDDPGAAASGIDTVLVSYELDGVENSVPAYTTGYNTFEAKIPAQSPGTVVKYNIRVADKDGNVGFGSGTYSVPEEQLPAQNQTPPGPQPGSQGQGGLNLSNLPIEIIVVGLTTFAIIAYGAYYYFTQKKQNWTPPPPPPPPQPGK